MKVVRRILVRLTSAFAVVAAGLVFPQQVAWSAPEIRSQVFEIDSGDVFETDFPATHAVVAWNGDSTASIEVRGSKQSGEWSAWQPVTVDAEELVGAQSGMVLLDAAQQVEVRVLSGAVADLRIDAIDAVHGPRHLVLRPAEQKAEAEVNAPSIISRAGWGANEGMRKGSPEFAPVNQIVVHHTATANNDPNPAATVRAILSWHTQTNGWNDIGYNFLIDQQGNIYEGRYSGTGIGEDGGRNGVIGAHAVGHNTGSVGVSMLGTFNTVAPTGAQQDALKRIIAWKADRHNIDLTSPNSVVGHRDVGQTECPGDKAEELLTGIRQDAAALKLVGSFQPGTTPGYWIAGTDGRVLNYGAAPNYGSMAGQRLNGPITSMTRTASAQGYWLMGTDGGIFSFGDAFFWGSMGGHKLNAPVVGLAATPTGKGYWLVASDGGIFAFGDAEFFGSMGGKPPNKPIIAMAPTPTGKGYWLVASDGGIFAFGDAGFFGSTGSIKLAQPVVTIAPAPDGIGYWLMAADGGVFAFNRPFYGSVPMLKLRSYGGTVEAAATSSGRGYYMLSSDGGLYTFGDARFHGAASGGVRAAAISVLPG